LPSVSENRSGWDGAYNWQERGDEWSRSWGSPEAQWWTTVFPRIRAFVPTGRILEIAPGFGRWTHFLKDLCDELVAVDLSEECIAACRQRFAGVPHLSTHVNDGLTLPMVADASIDFAITLDSLVHVEQDVLDSYLAELSRVLAPEGVAFVHHSNMGDYGVAPGTAPHWRGTTASARLVEETARSLGLACIAQERLEWGRNTDYLSDAFTVVCRAGSSLERPNVIRDAPKMTVIEGELATRLDELYSPRPAARVSQPPAPTVPGISISPPQAPAPPAPPAVPAPSAPEPTGPAATDVDVPSEIPRRRVLVAGIYLADKPNTVREAIASLESDTHEVVQRWIALGGEPADEAVAAVTTQVIQERAPKYGLLNRILETEDLQSYDYVVLCDDDVLLAEGFLDKFLPIQERLGFALAGPARTPGSFIDHVITKQQPGVLARRTRFVEIGPVVVAARRAFEYIFPFDESNGMGWGFENVWTHRLESFGLTLGIVDALPVDHSLRPPVENYSWDEADAARTAYLAANRHVPTGELMKVLEVVALDEPIAA